MVDTLILNKILAMMVTLLGMMSSLVGGGAPVGGSPGFVLGATNAIPDSVALFSTTLASAITTTATSMTLTSGTYNNGASTLASSTYAFVIDEGSSNSELVLADCTSTTCTNMTRGLDRLTGTSTVTDLRFSHRRGASVKITDGPQLMILSRILNGIATVPNKLSYTSSPTFTSGNELVTKTYVDSGVLAGAATSTESTTGIVRLATALQTASSTTSTANTPLVIQAQNATSTYGNGSTSGLKAVVTQNNGKIDQGFLDLSQSYTWSGLHTFTGTATTTFSATTSMPSLNLTGAQPATGNLSRLLLATTTNVTIGAASTTVFSTTIPANVLYNAGYNGVVRTRINLSDFDIIVNDLWLLEVKYGGTSVCCMATSTLSPVSISNSSGFIDIDLYGNNANNSQEVFINATLRKGDAVEPNILAKTGSLSIDSTVPQILEIIARDHEYAGVGATVSQVSSFLMR